jgi:hypothetical protein
MIKKEELTKYSHSINLKLKTGIDVKIELYKFVDDTPNPLFAGSSHYKEDDFWNRVNKKQRKCYVD